MFALLSAEAAGVFVQVFKVSLKSTGSIKSFPFSFRHSSVSRIDPGLSTGTESAGCVCTFLQIDHRGSLCIGTGPAKGNRRRGGGRRLPLL